MEHPKLLHSSGLPGLNFMGSPFQSRCTGASGSVAAGGALPVPAGVLDPLLLPLLLPSRFSCSQAAISAVLICRTQGAAASAVTVIAEVVKCHMLTLQCLMHAVVMDAGHTACSTLHLSHSKVACYALHRLA